MESKKSTTKTTTVECPVYVESNIEEIKSLLNELNDELQKANVCIQKLAKMKLKLDIKV